MCYILHTQTQNDEFWPSSSDSDDATELTAPIRSIPPPIQRLFLFTLLWQFAFNVSNKAISVFFRFLKVFIQALGVAFRCDELTHAAETIPVGTGTVQKLLGVAQMNNFIQYVVCPKCHSVYSFDDCVIRSRNGSLASKYCQHIPYPNHPQHTRRKVCNTLLLKTVKTKSGVSLQAIKAYSYRSIKASVALLASNTNFLEDCEKWRNRQVKVPPSLLGDIYDGEVWKEFNTSTNGFLSSPFSYLLTLNVDWFQPYERSVYSIGAIYLTIQNLPRNIRYLPEYTILVGVMPGPKEASHSINSYLGPLVLELQQAWNEGFTVMSPHNIPVKVRLALCCVCCDIPASRKVSGFLGHSASLGCNKCYKRFESSFGQNTDYSGFDRECWELRTGVSHRQRVEEVKKETTKCGIAAAESRLGVRYSALLLLPYFDAVRFTVIDIMHNLFLGTAKTIFHLWLDKGILSKESITQIERKIALFEVPEGIGRLPGRIGSQYSAYTAKQWKNWILVYSAVVLKGFLPSEDLSCWLIFVRACSLLCTSILKTDSILEADKFFLLFCRRFELLYGKESCTPNMHLHLHLKECLRDYGPPHAFWCFPFERYNGLLGSYHSNKKSIEAQFMKKFLTSQAVQRLACFDSFFRDVFLFRNTRDCAKSNLVTDVCKTLESTLCVVNFHVQEIHSVNSFATKGIVIPHPPFYEKIFTPHQVTQLANVINQLYPSDVISFLPYHYHVCGKVTLGDDLIGSTLPGGNNASSSVIMAYWPGSGDSLQMISRAQMRVGVVQYFVQHTVHLASAAGSGDSKPFKHVFAYVMWKKLHPQQHYFGASSIVCADTYELPGATCFLPVQRISCRAAHVVMQIQFDRIPESVFVACPLPINYHL